MGISDLDLPTGVVAHSQGDVQRQAEALADRVASALRSAVELDGLASLVVSGGRSPVPFLEALSRRELDWSRVQVSLADERWVPADHPESNEGLVRRHLLQDRAADARLISLYHPAESLEMAADKADEAVAALKRPVDVVVLGMGEDGHTASLFPGNPGLSAALDDACERACVAMRAPSEPSARISMTYPLLASARTQCLFIQGPGKLEAMARVLHATPLEMPIRAFLHSPLEIYWCP